MKFRFYTFGVPEGFDLYPNDVDRISYYQRYYDGSSENEKLSISRTPKMVSYSYLRYNHIGTRTGSFFGMALEFDGVYCEDISKLYKLFGQLYDAILKQGVLITLNEGGTPKFCVTSLKKAANVIDSLRANIDRILDAQFAGDFKALDATFKNGVNLDKVMLLNDNAGNATFIKALREFPMISISSSFGTNTGGGTVVDCVPQEKIDSLKRQYNENDKCCSDIEKECKIIQNKFAALALSFNEEDKKNKLRQIKPEFDSVQSSIESSLRECENVRKTIAEYKKIEPNLVVLAALAQNNNKIIDRLQTEKSSLEPYDGLFGSLGGDFPPNGGSSSSGGSGDSKPPTDEPWFKKYIKQICGGIAAVLVIVLLVVLWPSEETPIDYRNYSVRTSTGEIKFTEGESVELIASYNDGDNENCTDGEWYDGDKKLSSSNPLTYICQNVGEHSLIYKLGDDTNKYQCVKITVSANSSPSPNTQNGQQPKNSRDYRIRLNPNQKIFTTGNRFTITAYYTDDNSNCTGGEWYDGEKKLSSSNPFTYTCQNVGEHNLIYKLGDDTNKYQCDKITVSANSSSSPNTQNGQQPKNSRNYRIKLNPNQTIFTTGNRFTITAFYSDDNSNCTGGEWSYDCDVIEISNKQSNPAEIKCKTIGKVKLTYKLGNDASKYQAIEITINE